MPRLPGIEALRGLAACAVVLCHAARHVDKVRGAPRLILWFQAGHAGVDLFFVISGFVILTVHAGDIGRPARLAHYLGRRLTRVLPPYWLALGLTAGLGVAGGHAMPGALAVLWSALLLPSFGEPILGIAWTLQFEMLFYALFAVLIAGRRAGIAAFSLWLAASLAVGLGLRPPWPSALGSAYAVEFFFGMAASHASRRWRVPAPRLVALAGAGCLLCGAVLESAGRINGFGPEGRLVYGLAAMVLVLGVASTERSGALAVPVALRKLGGASYSIYLFQFLFIGLVWQVLLKTGLARGMGEWPSVRDPRLRSPGRRSDSGGNDRAAAAGTATKRRWTESNRTRALRFSAGPGVKDEKSCPIGYIGGGAPWQNTVTISKGRRSFLVLFSKKDCLLSIA